MNIQIIDYLTIVASDFFKTVLCRSVDNQRLSYLARGVFALGVIF